MKQENRIYEWLRTECEHCDSEHQRSKRVGPSHILVLGRVDYLRGHVCPSCDSSLDEMLREKGTKGGAR